MGRKGHQQETAQVQFPALKTHSQETTNFQLPYVPLSKNTLRLTDWDPFMALFHPPFEDGGLRGVQWVLLWQLGDELLEPVLQIETGDLSGLWSWLELGPQQKKRSLFLWAWLVESKGTSKKQKIKNRGANSGQVRAVVQMESTSCICVFVPKKMKLFPLAIDSL